MTQEEKQLLLKDLCARLPYGVKGTIAHYDGTTKEYINLTGTCKGIDYNQRVEFFYDDEFTDDEGAFNRFEICLFKPYLRPLSSMTEDELWERDRLKWHSDWEAQDFLDSIHVDYRGLIWKGLAMEAPEGMYPTHGCRKDNI